MQEFNAFLDLLLMLATDPRTGVLMALLVIAAVIDCRSYRIPNWLTLGGIVFALIYRTLFARTHLSGFTDSMGGLLVGFGIMLPLYVLKAMGAGDVKLMAMVGAFLGVQETLYAVLFTFIVGGVAAITFALFNKAAVRMFANIRNVIQNMFASATLGLKVDARVDMGQSVGRLPYAVSICVGTIVFVLARQLGFA